MRQLALTDDEVFDRQQIRKLAAKEEPAPIAVLPGQPACRDRRYWQRPRTNDQFSPCRHLGVWEARDPDDREIATGAQP